MAPAEGKARWWRAFSRFAARAPSIARLCPRPDWQALAQRRLPMIRLAESKGATMVEIRRLKQTEPAPPQGGAWILIEKKGDLYFIRGHSKDASVEASLAGTGIDSARLAIMSAEAWADLLTADLIYVRDDP